MSANEYYLADTAIPLEDDEQKTSSSNASVST